MPKNHRFCLTRVISWSWTWGSAAAAGKRADPREQSQRGATKSAAMQTRRLIVDHLLAERRHALVANAKGRADHPAPPATDVGETLPADRVEDLTRRARIPGADGSFPRHRRVLRGQLASTASASARRGRADEQHRRAPSDEDLGDETYRQLLRPHDPTTLAG